MSRIVVNGYKGTVYAEGKGFTGALDLGYHPDGRRNRPKRKGPTKTAVIAKLTKLAEDLDDKVRTANTITVSQVVAEYVDALERGGKAPATIALYRQFLKNHIEKIGPIRIKDLEPAQVSEWLIDRAKILSSETLRKVHGLLTRSINRAIVFRYVKENVSLPVERPKGTESGLRESKSFTVEQTGAILRTAVSRFQRFGGYVALALTSGLRVDELNGLTWKWLDVDGDEPTVYVERAARTDGKLKTKRSRRGLTLGAIACKALKVWREVQRREFAALNLKVTEDTPVFTRPDGSAYEPDAARDEFRALLAVAGIESPEGWTLRETRTTFVSVMSHKGIAREVIADMCGHTLKTLERHYRKVLAPVHHQSAAVIDGVFGLAA